MIKYIEHNGYVFQVDNERPFVRFKGGKAPAVQPLPMLPTRASAEIGAATADIKERRLRTKGRAESVLSVPGLASVNPNLNIPSLKDKLG